MVKKKKAAIFDIDDTIVSFLAALTKIFNHHKGTCVDPSDLTAWDFNDLIVKDVRGNIVKGIELRDMFLELENHGLYCVLPVIEPARRALVMAKDLGYEIILMTARREQYRWDTIINLAMNDIPYSKLEMCEDKSSKIMELKNSYDIEMFADDKLSTVEKVAEVCNLKYNFVINQAHNANSKISKKVSDKIIRIDDLYGIAKYLK